MASVKVYFRRGGTDLLLYYGAYKGIRRVTHCLGDDVVVRPGEVIVPVGCRVRRDGGLLFVEPDPDNEDFTF